MSKLLPMDEQGILRLELEDILAHRMVKARNQVKGGSASPLAGTKQRRCELESVLEDERDLPTTCRKGV